MNIRLKKAYRIFLGLRKTWISALIAEPVRLMWVLKPQLNFEI